MVERFCFGKNNEGIEVGPLFSDIAERNNDYSDTLDFGRGLRLWSSWTANSDKKLNVNKPCATSRKTVFRKFCKIFCQFLRCHKFW